MSVYVDHREASFGRMKMCHMLADSSTELLAMADKIGVDRRWLQYPRTHREHFDISKSKRALAIQHGAIEVSARELGKLLVRRRRALESHIFAERYEPGHRECIRCLCYATGRDALLPCPGYSESRSYE